MSDGTAVLSHAVRLPVVARYLGQLGIMLGLLTVPPLLVALLFGEPAFSTRFGVVAALVLLISAPALRLPAPEQIQVNEAMVVVCLAFVIAPLLMAFPLGAGGLAFEDALFEAVSAITTTGLSTAGSLESASPAFLFARAWMQWYGGLGIAVLSVALLMGHYAAARRLAEPNDTDNLATTARTQARQALWVYLVLTAAGGLVLWVAGVGAFDAMVHMLSTLSTGGFSVGDGSLAALPRAGAWVLTAFSLLGAIPLVLYFHAATGRPGELLRDPEARALLVLVVVASLLLAFSLQGRNGTGWGDALSHGFMLGTSAQTTTGFSSLAVGELDPMSKLLMIFSMVIGGASGSTAGGIKLLRLLVVLRLLQFFVRRTALPQHAVAHAKLGGRVLEPVEIERVLLVLVMFAVVTASSWLAFLAYGHDPLDALFDVVSAVGTVGLSTGVVGPALESPLKLLLCLVMLLGRLEILALLVLLYPGSWIGKRS
jgi:trk system potassium uptake protein TrkH